MAVGPVCKGTLFFLQNGYGWTESYYWKTSQNPILKTECDWLIETARKRQSCCGKETAITAVRVSMELDANDQKVLNDSYLEYTRLSAEVSTEISDEPITALQVIFREQGNNHRKFLFMRGIWDSIVTDGGKFKPDYGNWQGTFDAWANRLTAKKCGWLGREVDKKASVTNYTVDDKGIVRINVDKSLFTPDSDGKYQPQYVRIAGVNDGNSGLNGSVLVKGESAQVCKTVKPLGILAFKTEGKITTYKTKFYEAVEIDGQKIVNRKAGAPLLESRGRSRARVRV